MGWACQGAACHSSQLLSLVSPAALNPCLLSPLQGLTLLDALLKYGSDRVVDEARDHIFRIRGLTDFSYMTEGSDKGAGGE